MFKLAIYSSLMSVAIAAGATGPKARHHAKTAANVAPAASVKAASAPAPVPAPNWSKLVASARQAYADGEYARAAKIYESLPPDAPVYLRSREELAWTYLRQENWLKLRGLLPDLNSKLVPLRWRLEGRVLSSMLLLKECQYDKVQNELRTFQDEMTPLAREIDKRLKSSAHPAYWQTLKAEAGEAVFKMKFVRMELRSRLVMLAREQAIDTPAAKNDRERFLATQQTYPVDGDVWADELFVKRGEGKSACAAIHKSKVIQ